jgi:hypothetical protein
MTPLHNARLQSLLITQSKGFFFFFSLLYVSSNVRDLEVEHDVVVEHAVYSHPTMRSVQSCSCKTVLLHKLWHRNLVISCCFFSS